jgi:transcription elongation factor Elf1
MNWLEQKYVGMMSSRLRNYKRKSATLYNFSCPICGDSETVRSKARAYIYERKGRSSFHCHNCNASMAIPNLIKMVDQNLYNEFTLEKLKDQKSPQQIELETFVDKMKKPTFVKDTPLKNLKKISQLSADNKMKQYVVSRQIPTQYHSKLFVCPNFYAFTNEFIPNKFSAESLDKDESRLLIPFIDKNKNMHAFQGRSLNPKNPLKYITIVLDESVEKLYGLDTVDYTRNYYVLEGPIDSMFIPNAIATAGGDLVSALSTANKSNAVVVYDNEPRSKDTIKKIDKAIMQGYNVCIWPDNLEHKDINDMIKAGLSSDFIKYIIDQNTYKDLAAMLALKKWSKV